MADDWCGILVRGETHSKEVTLLNEPPVPSVKPPSLEEHVQPAPSVEPEPMQPTASMEPALSAEPISSKQPVPSEEPKLSEEPRPSVLELWCQSCSSGSKLKDMRATT
ncbi:hypothetical protein SLE2022_381760 [Rubroshorea leprosula]